MSNHKPNILPVIPQPRKIKLKEGHVRLDKKSAIILPESVSESILSCATLIQEKAVALCRVQISSVMSDILPKAKGVQILLGIPSKDKNIQKELAQRELVLSHELGDEGYLLHVDDDIILITANTEKGIFYGTQTFLQLMENKRNRIQVQHLTIDDYPLFKIRGVSDDISRGQISTLDDFKNIIRTLASFKINYYLPYIEDMFQFEKYPEIGVTRGHLTKAEARELVDYAGKYHIEVVPVFECLGHQDRILSIPRFNHLAERPEKPWCFAPVVEETYSFLADCIKEMAEIFPAPYFCIGCDETYELGEGKSKELASKIGKDGVFAQHIHRIKQIVDKHGKQTWMYGDMPFSKDYPQLKDKLPKDIVMVNWIYHVAEDYPRANAIAEWGNPQIVSPAVHGWGRLFPDFEEANGNVNNLINVGHKLGAIGEIQSSWCDFGGENYREFNWYSYAYSADAGWNPDQLTRDWFDDVYFQTFYGTKNKAIQKIHQLLVKSNKEFKMYYSTTALALWRDQIEERATKALKYRSAKAKKLSRIAMECEKLLPQAEINITRHQDHIPLFRFVTKRIKLLSLRLQIPDRKKEILKLVKNPTVSKTEKENVTREYVQFIQEQKDLMQEIKVEFESLWLNYYKRPMLDANLEKYDKLNEYYDSLIKEMENAGK